jgi:hypothetical protein
LGLGVECKGGFVWVRVGANASSGTIAAAVSAACCVATASASGFACAVRERVMVFLG